MRSSETEISSSWSIGEAEGERKNICAFDAYAEGVKEDRLKSQREETRFVVRQESEEEEETSGKKEEEKNKVPNWNFQINPNSSSFWHSSFPCRLYPFSPSLSLAHIINIISVIFPFLLALEFWSSSSSGFFPCNCFHEWSFWKTCDKFNKEQEERKKWRRTYLVNFQNFQSVYIYLVCLHEYNDINLSRVSIKDKEKQEQHRFWTRIQSIAEKRERKLVLVLVKYIWKVLSSCWWSGRVHSQPFFSFSPHHFLVHHHHNLSLSSSIDSNRTVKKVSWESQGNWKPGSWLAPNVRSESFFWLLEGAEQVKSVRNDEIVTSAIQSTHKEMNDERLRERNELREVWVGSDQRESEWFTIHKSEETEKMATINSSIKEEQPPPPPSATTINPLSSFHHPSCAVSRCQQHRRAVRKQLFKWSKNVLYLVGKFTCVFVWSNGSL